MCKDAIHCGCRCCGGCSCGGRRSGGSQVSAVRLLGDGWCGMGSHGTDARYEAAAVGLGGGVRSAISKRLTPHAVELCLQRANRLEKRRLVRQRVCNLLLELCTMRRVRRPFRFRAL